MRPRLLIQLVGEDGSDVLAEAKLTDFSATIRLEKMHRHAEAQCAGIESALKRDSGKRRSRGSGHDFPFPAAYVDESRPGGLRADMVQLLADLRPGFMRFPGGCIVEGSQLDAATNGRIPIGPIEERKLTINRWNYEFIHRPTPDYFQSFGLGFFRVFQLCQDIASEPLPILNCGMACQFNSGELCPLDQLGPFIQDALDLVEFANGPADSPWGARRAAMGILNRFICK